MPIDPAKDAPPPSRLFNSAVRAVSKFDSGVPFGAPLPIRPSRLELSRFEYETRRIGRVDPEAGELNTIVLDSKRACRGGRPRGRPAILPARVAVHARSRRANRKPRVFPGLRRRSGLAFLGRVERVTPFPIRFGYWLKMPNAPKRSKFCRATFPSVKNVRAEPELLTKTAFCQKLSPETSQNWLFPPHPSKRSNLAETGL
jgi:hypothetical protein